jgi:hypothetical protein
MRAAIVAPGARCSYLRCEASRDAAQHFGKQADTLVLEHTCQCMLPADCYHALPSIIRDYTRT